MMLFLTIAITIKTCQKPNKPDNYIIPNFIPNESIVNQLEKYTVEIVSIDPELGRCTGVVIKETPTETYVITAKHCVYKTEEQYIETVKPSFVFVSAKDDLALFVVNGKIKNKEPVTLNMEEIKVDDHVYLLGYPYWDKTPYTSDGKILRISDDWVWGLFKSIGGCSGGGIFNDKNELVGILWGGINTEGITMLESNKDIKEFLELAYRKLK